MRTEARVNALAFVFFVLAGEAQAQSATPVLVDIAPCMAIAASSERYACYDTLEAAARAAFAAQQAITAAPPPAPTIPATTPQAAETRAPAPVQRSAPSVATFGQASPAEIKAAEVIANSTGEEELHDRIAKVQEREPGRQLITLESGQVWYQSNSERFRLVKGMAIRIYPSPLKGSYRLARDDGKETGFIQVARVQ